MAPKPISTFVCWRQPAATIFTRGLHLKVVTEAGARGLQVVKVLHIGELGREVAPVERREVDLTEDTASSESRGTVKWYNPEKGFGFIAPESGENDIFVHATALARSGLTTLEDGQRVFFQSGQGKKGMEVRSIRLA
jgi:CspA family cold shock protein